MAAIKVSSKVKELKLKADQAYAGQKWKKALELYIESDKEQPDDPRMVQRIGDLHRRLNQTEEAIVAYKRITQIYSTQGFWAKAIAMGKLVIELDPSDTSIQHKLSQMVAAQTQKPSLFQSPPKGEEFSRGGQAISIAAASPRTIEDGPLDGYMGNVVELSTTSDNEPSTEESVLEMAEVVEDSPVSLGQPLDTLKGAPLFSQMAPNEFLAVMERMTVRRFPKQTLVCEEGDLGNSMFIVSEGWLEVFAKDKIGNEITLGTLRGGDFFGEFGLLTNGTRNASVRALIDSELLEITSTDFDVVASHHPQMWVILEEYLRKRLVSNILTKSEVFKGLSLQERDVLASCMRAKKVKMGEIITQQETPGEEMYFIKSGTVLVSLQNESRENMILGELTSGDYFGEIALLTGKPRTATVRAKTDCELFELKRSDAAKALKANQTVLLKLRDKMNERAHDTIAAHQSYMESRSTLNLV